jgi:NADH-quinone oxidoreductase subunit I
MNAVEFIEGFFSAVYSGTRQIFKRRMTLRYPEAVAYPIEGMYGYDPKKGVASNGWRGKHYLDMEKCTGCQLCAMACKNIAEAIEMVPVQVTYPQNKKEIYPSIDYGRCVFCGFCVDACPFYALFMTNDVELSELKRNSLFYTPLELYKKPELIDAKKQKWDLDPKRGAHHE